MTGTAETDGAVLISDAVGPPLRPTQVAAVLGLGVIALLMTGVMPALLGALVDEHRLSTAGIGRCAMLELLSIGVFTGLAGVVLPPERLRLTGGIAVIALAAVSFATFAASGAGVLALRAAAGLPEGVLLWIAIGMIARTETPARWSAVFLTGVALAQLVLAFAFAAAVLPRFGADGGFAAMGIATLLGLAAVALSPSRYAPLVKPQGESGVPPLLGWISLAAMLVFTASFGAVGIYLQPLAHAAGLSADVARLALSVSLAAQICGSGCATVLADRLHHLKILVPGALAFMCVWALYSQPLPAWGFVLDTGAAGFLYMLMMPFLVPMAIEADPSRRAALFSGGVQVLGGALGPLLSSFVVGGHGVRAALLLGATLIASGVAVMAGLHVATLRGRAHHQLIVRDV